MRKALLISILTLSCLFASAQVVRQTYHYDNPVSRTLDGYEILNLEGCKAIGDIGAPTLPWQSVSLMLPQGQEAQSISVKFLDFEELDGSFDLYPFQAYRPISAEGPFEFVKDESLYQSAETYPEKANSEVKTQYLNGVAFALSGFTPMRYVPATGKVSIAHTVVVSIETRASRADHGKQLWLRPENVRSMERLAQNKSQLASYQRRDGNLPQYELLVITPENYVGYFEDYTALYAQQGLRGRVIAKEDILASMDGRDNQEKIRNYILQEYQNSGITMVVLGGDVNLIPCRQLWCFAQEGYEDYVPSDLYYAGLDGTWNGNGNNLWGEVGEDDLFPEIGVSRIPFNNGGELETMLSKTFSYMTSPVLGEFRQTTFGGEHLGNGYYASSDLERLVGEVTFNGYTTFGYDENIYDINRVYATPSHEWNPDELRDAVRGGTQYVNHFGHAGTDYVAGWYNWDITPNLFQGANGVDHNYTLFHSQGCICGDFNDDCIMERMVRNETGILAAMGNSRYGWYSTAGDASSAHLNRELVDAHCHERIAELSLAFKECKIQTAPFVTMFGEVGTMRWSMYALNVIGDGTVSVWFDEPFTPEVTYPAQLQLGTKSLPVDVKDADGNPQYNFRCSLFNGDELIGLAITDHDGHADIEFYPVEGNDTLTLVVAGMSAWPQTFTITQADANCAYVIFDAFAIHDEDNQIDFGESHTFDITFRNVGALTGHNLSATLVAQNPEYITITQGTANIANMEGFSYTTLTDAFAFEVCDSIPDRTEIGFTLQCTDGTDIWTSTFSTIAYAPDFFTDVVEIIEVEGNGNGIADPGETLTLRIEIINTGNSDTPDAHFGIYCSAPEIMFDQNEFPLGPLAASDTTLVDFTFTISENLSEATAFELILCSYYGRYLVQNNYFVNVGCEVEDFETGDFSKFNWQRSVRQWTITSRDAYEGNFCAKSPNMSDNQSASFWLDYEVAAENEFSFYYKVSSEMAYDWLTFFIDDELYERWSGETDWSKATFVLPQGQHQLKWQYAKDAGVSSGEDCAWVDFIVFPPTVTVLGVGNDLSENANLYPNPSQGDFTINMEEISDITIFNTLGQTILHLEKAEGTQNLHLEQKGLYLIQIRNAKGVETQKIIIK